MPKPKRSINTVTKTIANADRFDSATTGPRSKSSQPADHGTTPDQGPGTKDEGGGMKDELDKSVRPPPMADFFGFFGALKKGLFWGPPKKRPLRPEDG